MRGVATSALLVPLALYALTAAPSVTFVDSGELAAVSSTLGIAHPTGYPLYTLLGRMLTALPGPPEPVVRLTWLSGLLVSVGTALLGAALLRVLLAAGADRTAARLAAVAASLTMAAGATLWRQAVVVEVYALAFLLLALLLLLAVRAAGGGRTEELLFAYVAGLAVSNHGSAAPLVPALALPLLVKWGLGNRAGAALALIGGLATLALPVHRGAGLVCAAAALALLLATPGGRVVLRRLLALAPATLLGLSIYLYLPIRSAMSPMLDWGDPESMGSFLRHITGKVYHVWFLSSWETPVTQLGRFARQLVVEMTPLALLPMAAGLVIAWRRHRTLALLTLLVLVLNLLYATNYDIHDIESYFLPAFMVGAIWIGVALAATCGWLRRRAGLAAAAPVVLLLPALAVALNLGVASQRHDYLVRDYTDTMFASLEPNAVIVSRQWDTFCSAALYDQLVREQRADVTVIEKELMRRSWYLSQLERWDPELAAPCRDLAARYRVALAPFETGGEFDAPELQRLYVGLIQCLLESGEAAGRPVYLTPDAHEEGIGGGFVPVPTGLAMRLYRQLPASPPPGGLPRVRGLDEAVRSREAQPAQLAALVLEMWTRRAMLLASYERIGEARAVLDQVLAVDPEHLNARLVAERLDRLGGDRP